MMLRVLALGAVALSLGGCASNRLYQWGGYEERLYAAYKDPTQVEVLRQRLEAHIQATEQAGGKVAPGLYAELGTLYLQAGQRARASALYARERQAWPESRQLMTAMIQNLERLGAPASPEAAR